MATFPRTRSDSPVVVFSDAKSKYSFSSIPSHQQAIDCITRIFRELKIFYYPADRDFIEFDCALREFLVSHSIQSDANLQQTTVFRFAECPGWVVKRAVLGRVGQSAAGTIEKAMSYAHYYNNLFRPIMDEWMREVIQKHQFKVILPKEYLIPIPVRSFCGEEIPEFLPYVVLSEEEEVFEREEVVQKIQNMPLLWQKLFVDYHCEIIYETGFSDATLGNLCCLSKTKQTTYFGKKFSEMVVVDTEPFGYMVDEKMVDEKSEKPLSQLAPGIERKKFLLSEAAYAGLCRYQKDLEENGFEEEVLKKVDTWIQKAKKEISFENQKDPKKRRFTFFRKKN